jgi:Mrp family chromosome partitioning ATPase
VDLPPIAITSDARSLAEFVDRFLLVARWRQADASLILEALRLNRPVQEKLFASVLNQAELAELRPEDGSFGSYAAYFDQTRQTANPSAAASVFTAPHATQQVTRREKVLPFK